MTIRRAQLTVAVVIGLAFAIGPAWAHARLKSSSPPKDSIVKTGLAEIKLTFNETIEPSLSVVELYDALGQVLVTSKGTPIRSNKVCTRCSEHSRSGTCLVVGQQQNRGC